MPNFGSDFVDSNLLTSNWVREVRSYAQGSNRQAVNVLAADFDNATQEELTLRFPIQGMQPGQTVEIGWVEYSIVDISPSSKALTVITTDEDAPELIHEAGARVTYRPRFTVRRIIDALNAELDQLSAEGVYRVVSVPGATDGGVDLPGGALRVLEVWSNEEFQRELPPAFYKIADSASGPVLVGPSTVARAAIGCALNHLPSWQDAEVVGTTGLLPQAVDIPPLGAAMRLMIGAEAQRAIFDSQGETRRAGEVPTGGPTTAMRNLAALRHTRVTQEAQRILERYGYKTHVGAY